MRFPAATICVNKLSSLTADAEKLCPMSRNVGRPPCMCVQRNAQAVGLSTDLLEFSRGRPAPIGRPCAGADSHAAYACLSRGGGEGGGDLGRAGVWRVSQPDVTVSVRQLQPHAGGMMVPRQWAHAPTATPVSSSPRGGGLGQLTVSIAFSRLIVMVGMSATNFEAMLVPACFQAASCSELVQYGGFWHVGDAGRVYGQLTAECNRSTRRGMDVLLKGLLRSGNTKS